MPGEPDENPTIWGRLSRLFLKPSKEMPGEETPGSGASLEPAGSDLTKLQEYERVATDKERAIGLIAAPFGAVIALAIVGALNNANPTSHYKTGKIDHNYDPKLYIELLLVLVAVSVVMLAAAWWRKRLYLGLATALYGLTTFNLHYWGFGVPYLGVGGWYLTRAYRARQAVRNAGEDGTSGGPGSPGGRGSPPPSKRFTPPSTRPKRKDRG
jgi:hypothetical protein